jgi:hypothetical protein
MQGVLNKVRWERHVFSNGHPDWLPKLRKSGTGPPGVRPRYFRRTISIDMALPTELYGSRADDLYRPPGHRMHRG